MPFIHVKTSVDAPQKAVVDNLLTTLSANLAQHLGKPESYIMTVFEPNLSMTFGGTFDPVCFIEVKNIGTMSPTQTKAMSQDFCQLISEVLGVSPNRIYLEFADAQRHLWGWNSSTF
jgi:phenylpyruvate tautomerase